MMVWMWWLERSSESVGGNCCSFYITTVLLQVYELVIGRYSLFEGDVLGDCYSVVEFKNTHSVILLLSIVSRSFSSRRPGFNLRVDFIKRLVDKWAPGQSFRRVRLSSLFNIIPPQIHAQISLAHYRRYIISVTNSSAE